MRNLTGYLRGYSRRFCSSAYLETLQDHVPQYALSCYQISKIKKETRHPRGWMKRSRAGYVWFLLMSRGVVGD